MEEMHKAFGNEEGNLPHDLPLFPTKEGGAIDKVAAVQIIADVAEATGQTIYTPDGGLTIGAHTLRVTGAQFLASLGIHILMIKTLARHSSEAILRYVALAPLNALTDEYRRRMQDQDLDQRILSLREDMLTFKQNAITEVGCKTHPADEKVQQELSSLHHRIEQVEKYCPRYITNSDTSKTHEVLLQSGFKPSEWITRCGWKLALNMSEKSENIPSSAAHICDPAFL